MTDRETLFASRLRDRLRAISGRDLADRTLDPGDAEALAEIIDAAFGFVATTSIFRQQRACRDEFERLAWALMEVRDD